MRNGRGTEEDGNDKRRKVARVQEEECCETRGRWWGGRARIRRAAYIRESYFNILSALRGITHTHEWTANIWNGPQTWRGWLPPFPLREKGKRKFEGERKNCRLKLLIRHRLFHRFARLEMYANGLPTDISTRLLSLLSSRSISSRVKVEMLEDGIRDNSC